MKDWRRPASAYAESSYGFEGEVSATSRMDRLQFEVGALPQKELTEKSLKLALGSMGMTRPTGLGVTLTLTMLVGDSHHRVDLYTQT